LPDGLFWNPKSQFWVNFGWFRNGRCWYILWPSGLLYSPFGVFNGHLVCFGYIFFRFGMLYKEKSGTTTT
jgi:hypothetical protein